MRLKAIGVVIVTFITTQDRGLIDHIIALETEVFLTDDAGYVRGGGSCSLSYQFMESWNNGWRLEITRVLLGPNIKGCY